MRKIPSAKKFKIRLGTRFTKISLFLSLIGAALFTVSLSKDVHSLPAAVAILLIGVVLTAISQIRANNIIRLIQTGRIASGTFKEWRNSFIIYSNSAMVYLIYTYRDHEREKREVAVLSSSTKAREEVTVIYDEENSVVLEHLPGQPVRDDLMGGEAIDNGKDRD